MRNDKHLAIIMRKKGNSYKQISKELGIPKSTMHYWFKDLDWSEDIREKLTEKNRRTSRKRIRKVIKANQERWRKWRASFRKEAAKEFSKLKNNSLFVAGIMLYWGEGDGNLKNEVRLTNVDYRMVALFKRFLLNVCNISMDDIVLSLFIYPDLSEKKCKEFWSKKIKIPLIKFDKTQIIYGKHPTKRLENGICTIRIKRSRGFKEKIVVWTELLYRDFV
jgi:hypothetical protein